MKSLQESLFDNNLIDKPVTLSKKAIYDIINSEVYKALYRSLDNADWPKHNWIMIMCDKWIHVSRSFNVTHSTQEHRVYVCLEFEFNSDGCPKLPVILFKEGFGSQRVTKSDIKVVARWIKNADILKWMRGTKEKMKVIDKTHDCFLCNSNTIKDVCNIISFMIQLIAYKMTDLIQNEIDKYEPENPVPPIVIEQTIMKKLIKELNWE